MLFDTLLTHVILTVLSVYSGTWRSQGRNVNAIGTFVGEFGEIYGNFKFASTSNIYGFGILILTLYCVIRILPKIMSVLCFNPHQPPIECDRTVGAERPRTWGGSTLNLGRNDRTWGGRGADRPRADRLWGGSTGTPINWYLSIVNMIYENIILLIGWFQFGTVYLIIWWWQKILIYLWIVWISFGHHMILFSYSELKHLIPEV